MSLRPGEKSYVGMGYSLCPVCGAKHDEVVLVHRLLHNSLPREQATGWDLCPEHKKLKNEGYIALIECTNQPKSLNDAQRTGQIAHVRGSAWTKIFNCQPPDKGLAFVEAGVIAKLQEIPHAG